MVENHDFNETVDHLARRAGIGSSYPNPPDWTGRSGGGDDGRVDLFLRTIPSGRNIASTFARHAK